MNDDSGRFLSARNYQCEQLIVDGINLNVTQSETMEPISPLLTRRQWLTVTVFGVANLCSAVCISLQAPFYPQEAELKGVTATQYGFVFGIYELTSFLPQLGPRFVYIAGIFVTAGSCILFGLLDLVQGHDAFLGLSFAVRVVEALGSSGTFIAAFTIIAAEFPQSIATTFASLETFFGLGLIAGPTVGGILYQTGGFRLPFFVTGGVLFVLVLFSLWMLPGESEDTRHAATTTVANRSLGLLEILRVPSVCLAAFSVVCTSFSMGFISATLEPHLRQFNLSPVLVGLMFIITGTMYALTAPLTGFLCDRGVPPKWLVVMGSMLVIVSYMFMGPAPFLPQSTSLWMVIVGLILNGVGNGLLLVSNFVSALKSAIDSGFANNIGTYAVISGLWTSFFSLGDFMGPSMGGVLLDAVGFRKGSMVVVAIHLLAFVVHLCFLRLEARYQLPHYTHLAPGAMQQPLPQEDCPASHVPVLPPSSF